MFAQNIDYGYTQELAEAVLTTTHNLCFGSKTRKIDKTRYTPKVGYMGVYISRTCFPSAQMSKETFPIIVVVKRINESTNFKKYPQSICEQN